MLYGNKGYLKTNISDEMKKIVFDRTKELEDITVEFAKRAKYIKFGRPKIEFCVCGKHKKISPLKDFFWKKTCGNNKCVPYSYDIEKSKSLFKKTIQENKAKKHSRCYSLDEQINFVNSCQDVNKVYKEKNKDIVKYMWSEAKRMKMKKSQYVYHLIKIGNFDVPKCCVEEKKFYSFDKGYSSGCKRCQYENARNARKNNKMLEMENRIKQTNKFSIIEKRPINEGPWSLKCVEKDHVFSCFVKNGKVVENIKCPVCHPKNKSVMEYEVIEKIQDFYDGEIIHTYRLEKTKNRGAYKTIDIFVPEFRLGIELNGIFWHKNDDVRHLEKRELCKRENIELIQFTDLDIKEKIDIVMSVISNKLQKNKKIFARNCVIKEIDNSTYKKFCEENHLMGYSAASIKLGSYFENDLISVFSMGKSRFCENEYELIRFCSKIFHSNVGILSKFVKYIGKNYPINEIITYCNLSHATGNGYKKIGFEEVSVSPPNYYYFNKKEDVLLSRMAFQKHKLKSLFPELYSDEKTEKQIMKEADYDRYYDCGNLKLKYVFAKNECLSLPRRTIMDVLCCNQ